MGLFLETRGSTCEAYWLSVRSFLPNHLLERATSKHGSDPPVQQYSYVIVHCVHPPFLTSQKVDEAQRFCRARTTAVELFKEQAKIPDFHVNTKFTSTERRQ